MKKYGFGVDVGGTTVKMGFFETSGELLDKYCRILHRRLIISWRRKASVRVM